MVEKLSEKGRQRAIEADRVGLCREGREAPPKLKAPTLSQERQIPAAPLRPGETWFRRARSKVTPAAWRQRRWRSTAHRSRRPGCKIPTRLMFRESAIRTMRRGIRIRD